MATRTGAAAPTLWRDLLAIMAGNTLVGMAISFTAPLLALVLEARGYSAFTIGLNSAVASVGIFLTAPFLPWLLRRFGPIRCIQAGTVVVAAALLSLTLSESIVWWFVIRLLIGIALSVPFVFCEAAVNALADDASRGKVIGIYGTLFSAGFAAGPLVLAAVGSQGVLPFAVGAAILVLGVLPVGLAVNADRAMSISNEIRLPMVWTRAPLPLVAICAYGFVEVALFGLYPVYGLSVGMTGAGVGVEIAILLAGSCLLQMPIGWLADHLPRASLLLACSLSSVVLILLLPLATQDTLVRWAVLVLAGGTLGGLYTMALVLLGERFTGADLAVANTAFVMFFQIGAVAGPSLSGLGMSLFGPFALLPTLALALGATAIVHLARSRRGASP
ncbi:MFS transporter [Marinivivus vitaminiproducens]|uniref:MFS transporter n=1 Tax=Marinivivus vitaminiproducens TaxID=3035935 RepID=UPI0027A1AB16|nr:MFS transporter [Geminicoccaceae bacterium SCSIO 64248]